SAWQAIYSARSGDTIRRNAMLLPLYMAFLPLMMFAGFAASLVHAGLKGAAVDQSFLLLVQQYYPPWALGIIAGAGALAALIPASALLLAGASVVTKNIAGDLFGIVRSDAARTMLTRILVVMVALLALGLWLTARRTIAELLLLYFNGVAQFAPGAFAAFFWPRVTAVAVGAGIAVGLGIGIPLAAMNLTPWGVNPGLLALLANGAVAAFVTLLTRQKAV
ncbi:MAG: hypothetical protein JO030_05335, partial [Candidatus Eremiobacteraeota bacterium]|nr:hypothetical protein [Candidatus Eremiobacteraeota bacterium]